MNKRYRFLLALAVALLLWSIPGTLLFSYDAQSAPWKESIETPAPDFALKDLEGNNVRLSDYRGKVVLLNFTTTWCPQCRKIIPYLKELYGKYRSKGFEILNIDIQESTKRVSAFVARYEIPYRVLLDENAHVATLYGVVGVPSLILINRDGIIVCRQCRSIDDMLEKLF
jgi:peroxiredoxin